MLFFYKSFPDSTLKDNPSHACSCLILTVERITVHKIISSIKMFFLVPSLSVLPASEVHFDICSRFLFLLTFSFYYDILFSSRYIPSLLLLFPTVWDFFPLEEKSDGRCSFVSCFTHTTLHVLKTEGKCKLLLFIHFWVSPFKYSAWSTEPTQSEVPSISWQHSHVTLCLYSTGRHKIQSITSSVKNNRLPRSYHCFFITLLFEEISCAGRETQIGMPCSFILNSNFNYGMKASETIFCLYLAKHTHTIKSHFS